MKGVLTVGYDLSEDGLCFVAESFVGAVVAVGGKLWKKELAYRHDV